MFANGYHVVVVGYPSPSERWGIAGDHGAPEAGQLPRGYRDTRNDHQGKVFSIELIFWQQVLATIFCKSSGWEEQV